MDSMSAYALLGVAALGAGVLNAIAGGGSFLTFPALVATGVPPIVANATSAMAVAPGYLGSTLGFREEIAAQPRKRLKLEMLIVAIGGVTVGTARRLAAAGADFLAVSAGVWDHPEGPKAAVAEAKTPTPTRKCPKSRTLRTRTSWIRP